MLPSTPFLASVFATAFAILGPPALTTALAQDPAPAPRQSDAGANPIDTSITTQSPSHFKRGPKTRGSKKSVIVNSAGHSSDHRQRNLLRANGVGAVRNSIGQPVRPTLAILQGTQPKSSGQAGPAGNGGKNAIENAPRQQGFVPLKVGGVTSHHDPRLRSALNPSIINGRDMTRAEKGASAIGGAAKSNSGVISGTGIRPHNP